MEARAKGEPLGALAGVPVAVQVLDGVSHGTVIGAMARPLRFLAPVRAEVLAFLGLRAGDAK